MTEPWEDEFFDELKMTADLDRGDLDFSGLKAKEPYITVKVEVSPEEVEFYRKWGVSDEVVAWLIYLESMAGMDKYHAILYKKVVEAHARKTKP